MSNPQPTSSPPVAFTESYLEGYRFFRSRGYSAAEAARIASNEQVLRQRLATGDYQVDWEVDERFGLRVSHGVSIIHLRECRKCGNVEPTIVDSLWGIEIEEGDEAATKREYEAQLDF